MEDSFEEIDPSLKDSDPVGHLSFDPYYYIAPESEPVVTKDVTTVSATTPVITFVDQSYSHGAWAGHGYSGPDYGDWRPENGESPQEKGSPQASIDSAEMGPAMDPSTAATLKGKWYVKALGQRDQETVRVSHNAMERNRRSQLNDVTDRLRDFVPGCESKKVRRPQLLRKTVDYVQKITTKNRILNQRCSDLSQRLVQATQELAAAKGQAIPSEHEILDAPIVDESSTSTSVVSGQSQESSQSESSEHALPAAKKQKKTFRALCFMVAIACWFVDNLMHKSALESAEHGYGIHAARVLLGGYGLAADGQEALQLPFLTGWFVTAIIRITMLLALYFFAFHSSSVFAEESTEIARARKLLDTGRQLFLATKFAESEHTLYNALGALDAEVMPSAIYVWPQKLSCILHHILFNLGISGFLDRLANYVRGESYRTTLKERARIFLRLASTSTAPGKAYRRLGQSMCLRALTATESLTDSGDMLPETYLTLHVYLSHNTKSPLARMLGKYFSWRAHRAAAALPPSNNMGFFLLEAAKLSCARGYHIVAQQQMTHGLSLLSKDACTETELGYQFTTDFCKNMSEGDFKRASELTMARYKTLVGGPAYAYMASWVKADYALAQLSMGNVAEAAAVVAEPEMKLLTEVPVRVGWCLMSGLRTWTSFAQGEYELAYERAAETLTLLETEGVFHIYIAPVYCLPAAVFITLLEHSITSRQGSSASARENDQQALGVAVFPWEAARRVREAALRTWCQRAMQLFSAAAVALPMLKPRWLLYSARQDCINGRLCDSVDKISQSVAAAREMQCHGYDVDLARREVAWLNTLPSQCPRFQHRIRRAYQHLAGVQSGGVLSVESWWASLNPFTGGTTRDDHSSCCCGDEDEHSDKRVVAPVGLLDRVVDA